MLTAPSAIAPLVVDPRGDAEPHPLHAFLRKLLHEPGELVEQRRLRGRHRRQVEALVHGPATIDDPGESLRAAKVDTDDTIRVHGRSVT